MTHQMRDTLSARRARETLVKCRQDGKNVGIGKGVFWKRGLLKNIHFLVAIAENVEILQVLESSQVVENKNPTIV